MNMKIKIVVVMGILASGLAGGMSRDDQSSQSYQKDIFDNFSDEYFSITDLPDDTLFLSSHYQTYFAHRYNYSVIRLQQPEHFLYGYVSFQPICNAVTTSEDLSHNNTLVRENLVICHNKPTFSLDLKYMPLSNTASVQKLQRYNAFYNIMVQRYYNADKGCCGANFASVPDLRNHISREHKVEILQGNTCSYHYHCSHALCKQCPYISLDAAVSHILRKKNSHLFACPDCGNTNKSYTSFYQHYLVRCKRLSAQ